MREFASFVAATFVSGAAIAIYFWVDGYEGDQAGGLVVYTLLLLWGLGTGIFGISLDFFKVSPIFGLASIGSTVCNFCIAIPFLYASVYRAFEVSGNNCLSGQSDPYFFDELYFSYTTFVTLGYGDLKPVGWCRLLTSTESLIGYIFLGLLVAMIIDRFQFDRDKFMLQFKEEMSLQFSLEAKKVLDPKLVDKVMEEIRREESAKYPLLVRGCFDAGAGRFAILLQMAILASEIFNSYANASISGQNGGIGWTAPWSLNAGIANVASPLSGNANKALSLSNSAASIERLFVPTTTGKIRLTLYARKSASNTLCYFGLIINGQQYSWVHGGGLSQYRYGGGTTSGRPNPVAAINTWYKLSVEIDTTTGVNNIVFSVDDVPVLTVSRFVAFAGSYQFFAAQSGYPPTASITDIVIDDMNNVPDPIEYTLTCEPGTFTLTGTSTGLSGARRLTADTGLFALTGAPATLSAARSLSLAPGSFALTGFEAALATTRALALAPATYTLTGNPAGLYRVTVLSLEAGTFLVEGQNASIQANYALGAESGSFILSGAPVGLVASLGVSLEPGSYLLTGEDVDFIITTIASPFCPMPNAFTKMDSPFTDMDSPFNRFPNKDCS